MNISYNWLKEYVNFDLTPDEVAEALTSHAMRMMTAVRSSQVASLKVR